MTKVLMVCLGNICRSPLAEGILQSKLSIESFFVDFEGLPFHFPDRYTCDMSPFAGQWIMPEWKTDR